MSLLPAAILAASPTLARLAKSSSPAASAAGVNLNHASQEWSSRPADERFWTLDEAADAASERDSRLSLRDIRPAAATVEERNGTPCLIHKASGNAAPLSNVAFGQIARFASAPAGYLATLPADLASKCLAKGWEDFTHTREADAPVRLQVLGPKTDKSLPNQIRAITGTTHDLAHDSMLLRALANLTREGGWKIPPGRVPGGYNGPTRQATEADCLANAGKAGLSVRPGDEIAPSGVYVGDRDSFALLVDDSPRGGLELGSNGGGEARALSRFVTVSNCEVGQGKLEIITGWLDSVCGNHILWNCSDIISISAIHRGSNASRSIHRMQYAIQARNWKDDRAETAAHFRAMQLTNLAPTKADLITLLFGKKILSRTNAENAVAIGEELAHIDGNPRSAWGVMSAITRMSQASSHQADRFALDMAGAKVAELVSVTNN